MKLFTLTACFLTITLFTFSQGKKQTLNSGKFHTKEIELNPDKSTDYISLPFKSLYVFDRRNDTSIAGFANLNSKPAIITFKNGARNAIESYSKKKSHLQDTSKAELVMIIRKLWFSNAIENDIIYEPSKKNEKKYLPGLYARFEFYVRYNYHFTPVLRYDTIAKMKNLNESYESEMIESVINESLKKLSMINLTQRMNSGLKRTWTEIDSFSQQQQLLPVLISDEYNKGIYLTFQEFKTNKPSIKKYEIQKREFGNILIVKNNNNEEIPIRKIWGFCDGENFFIQSKNNYFQLTRKENAFYTVAPRDYSATIEVDDGKIMAATALVFISPSNNFLSNANPSLNPWFLQENKFALKLKPLQLDLDTGKLY